MKLSIIILSYNTKELLKQTLDSLPSYKDWEVIVVDNASTDGSVQLIKQSFPKMKLIENKQNMGYASGNNQAIKIAKGEYFLLLNSDVVVKPNAIESLLSYMEQAPRVGAITPKVLLPDGAIDLACHRGMPTPWRAFTYFSKLEQLFPGSKLFGGYHLTHLDFDQTHEIEAASGVAFMVRKEVIDRVGLLDERFFFYAEDLDWCLRITQAGWKIIYFPQATIIHHKSQSGKNNRKDKQKEKEAKKHFYDTMQLFYNKHYASRYPRSLGKLVKLTITLKKVFS